MPILIVSEMRFVTKTAKKFVITKKMIIETEMWTVMMCFV